LRAQHNTVRKMWGFIKQREKVNKFYNNPLLFTLDITFDIENTAPTAQIAKGQCPVLPVLTHIQMHFRWIQLFVSNSLIIRFLFSIKTSKNRKSVEFFPKSNQIFWMSFYWLNPSKEDKQKLFWFLKFNISYDLNLFFIKFEFF
jgi:hypothetical protein